jgi:hypothetical protein
MYKVITETGRDQQGIFQLGDGRLGVFPDGGMGQISRHRGRALLPQVMRRTPIYAADMKPVGSRLARDSVSLNNKDFRV